MTNRNGYYGKLAARSVGTSLKAAAIVIAGAAIVMFAMTLAKVDPGKSESPEAGKFVGIRHDAASISLPGDTQPGVPTPAAGQGQKSSIESVDTVVRNGITIVSPRFLVPVIDTSSKQIADGPQDVTSSGKVLSGKQARYARRSHTRRQPRTAARHWTAYGLAVR